MKKLLLKAMLLCMMSSFCVGTALAADSDWRLDSASGTIQYYYGTESDLVIPETIMGITITSIGKQAFCLVGDTLTSITMPDTITSIGEQAFDNCRLLTTVNFSQNLERIGEDAFKECSAITQWIFPDSLQNVGESGFGGHPSYIRMPANTVSGSFDLGFDELTQIDIPDQFVGTLRRAAFNVTLMNEVTLPGGCSLDFISLDYLEPDETGKYVQNKEKKEEISDSDFVFKVYNDTPAHYYCIDLGHNFELLGEWNPSASTSTPESSPSTSTPSTSTPSTGSSSSSGSSSSATEESNPMITLAIIGGVVVVLSVGVVAIVMKKK